MAFKVASFDGAANLDAVQVNGGGPTELPFKAQGDILIEGFEGFGAVFASLEGLHVKLWNGSLQVRKDGFGFFVVLENDGGSFPEIALFVGTL